MTAAYLTETAAMLRESVKTVPPGPWGTVEGTMGKLGEVTVIYGAAGDDGRHPQVAVDYGFEMDPLPHSLPPLTRRSCWPWRTGWRLRRLA